MKTLHLATITILVLVISSASAIYAQASSTVSASLAKVNVGLFNMTENSPTLVISGIVYKVFSQNIVLTIFNPQNQLISVSQLQPRLDETFSQSIIPSDPLWPKGNYTVRVASGSQNLTESIFYFPGIGCCKRIITPGVQDQLHNPINPLSPLKQFKSGIAAKDVKCILGFELILKTENNSPACVELETAQKFVDRGWANIIISNVLNSGTIVAIPVNSSISASGLTFSPSTIRVVIGVNNTVEWINMDSVMNDITSDDRSFETSLIPHGHAWEHIFDKTGTYQYHSTIHPWLKGTVIVVENNTSPQKISNSDQQAMLSENECGQFYTVPENHTSLNTVPVLLMKSNSTACARLTFTVHSNYADCNGPNCQHIFSLVHMIFIRNLHYEKNDESFSVTPGKNYTNSFKIMTVPDTVDLANYPLGANFTATYIISPLQNATGFYDQSIPRLVCERYPLAVGYAKDQVNASNFSYIDPLNPPCVSSTYMLTKVEVSGMDYKDVTLHLAVLAQK